jgi:hypothetical protein
MPVDITYRIAGLDQLLAAENTVGAKTEGILTDHLLRLGEDVAQDVRHEYLDYSVEGAYGVVAKVFTSGLWVVQTLEKSRDPSKQRPNFGPLMMREAFVPAVEENEPRIVVAADMAIAEATALYWDEKGV